MLPAGDVSGSMDRDEKQLQRDGYVAALRHPQVIDAIGSGFHGRIAVTYVEWAGPASQSIAVPWRLVDGRETAEALARDIAAAPNARIRGTSISSALPVAAGLVHGNGVAGLPRGMDLSGPRAHTQCPPP